MQTQLHIPMSPVHDLNALLNRAGLPALTPPVLSAMTALQPLQSLMTAARDAAAGNPRAKDWIGALMAQAGQNVPAPQGGAPGPNGGQGQGQSAPVPSGNGADPGRVSRHVYSGKAALTIETDTTRGGAATLAIDGALATGPRVYDWTNKIRIQLTEPELPVTAAVLTGALGRCEFSNHGPRSNKGFSMERQQAGRVFVKLFAKGEPVRAVPMEPPDVFWVAGLALRQIRRNQPWLDATAAVSLLGKAFT